MSESVDILIKAEDMATPVIAKSAKAVDGLDASVKRFKESGGQAKKSADFARVIAVSLGGSPLGAYIGQIGEAAEKTSQFAEVQKLGGAGALAFKAGLVGLVGTIAFGVGNAIGNVIFQTERWKQAMADATAEAARLESQLVSLKAQRFGDSKADIELIRDPEAKKAAYADLFQSTTEEIKGVEQRINSAKAKVEEYNASYMTHWQSQIDAHQETKAKLKTDQEALAVLKKQQEEVRSERLERELANKGIEKKNALQDKSDAYVTGLREELELLRATKEEQAEILAMRNAVGEQDQATAKALLLEKDAIAAKAEAEKTALAEVAAEEKEMQDARIKQANDEAAQEKRVQDLKESELSRLEEETIRLREGEAAAKAFRLEKEGLSKEDAKAIAQKEADLKVEADAKKPGKSGGTTNTAFEARLLTRGPADDAAKFTAQNTANALAELKAMNKRQERMEALDKLNKGKTLTVVA